MAATTRQLRVRDGVDEQRCCRCERWKPLAQFHRDRAKKNGLCGFCAVCNIARAVKWQQDHPVEYKARQKRYAREEKLRTFDQYGGPICTCCGETEIAFLTLDHVAGNGREDRERFRGSVFYVELRKRGYPPGFQVLCFNCNSGRWINGGTCPHKIQAVLAA